MLLPLCINTLVSLMFSHGPYNVGSTTRAYPPGFGMTLGWSFLLQSCGCSEPYMYLCTAGITAFTSLCRRS